MPKAIRYFILILLIVLIALCFGLRFFIYHICTPPVSPPSSVEAMVILTGGKHRLIEGINLFQEHKNSHKLLISGVHKNIEHDVLRNFFKEPSFPLHIDLGYEAIDTNGNAQETAQWLIKNNIQSFILVTSYYHMPRSLLEMKRTVQNQSLYPYPLFPSSTKICQNQWKDWVSFKVIILEFLKYCIIRGKYFLSDLLALSR